ncbi:MAG: AcrB/AcrD/AcrF family protein [Thermodesulfatator sp.]|nr:MAG: AcrB/AcrD/AcrF family protein [Thermodesulfatator sp.]
MNETRGFIARIVNYFVDSKLTPLIVMAMLALGVFAVLNTPSEEEPQIVVPMIDIFVEMPGATAQEIEQRVINPMEKLLWEIPGVEYVYSTAMNDRALTVVRFYVGQDVEKSLVKTYDKLYQHLDWIPPGCSMPLLQPRSINDVPIVTLTFWGKGYDAFRLRQIVARVDDEMRNIPGISETFIKGGLRREVRIELEPEKIYALGLDPVEVAQIIQAQNQARLVGKYRREGETFFVRLSNFFSDVKDLGNTVIKTVAGRPVFLKDVARIIDGPEEPEDYVFMVPGPAAREAGVQGEPGKLYPAVTLAIAKRKGWNATRLAHKILAKVDSLRGDLIPRDLHITVTRNYGETAKDKTDTLLEHLSIATVSVAILIALFLGVRASLVVLVAVPTVLAITLLIYFLYGYTLNRVTLFALIFCIGILVDDPIVDVENIVRHLHLPENKGKPFRDVIVGAVVEVQAPLILATLTVIAAIAPMGFVRGLMGPYMRPMPVGASVAMLFSMMVAFVITPWTAYHFLPKDIKAETEETWITRIYRWFMGHLIRRALWRWTFLFVVLILFLLSCTLIYFKVVYVKMLPFDNKNEFQVIVNMPEGSSLEETLRATEEMAQALMQEPLITNMQLYVGTAAPFNFNGLIRHYYLRRGDHVADIQVNLVDKHHRRLQSHDIAKRVRPLVTKVARRYRARVTVAEVPPGPPVLQSLVAEVYGPDYEAQIELARKIKEVFAHTPGVVDVDWYMTEPRVEWSLKVDRVKAALSGVTPERVKEALEIALPGKVLGLFHDPTSREDIFIRLRFPEAQRSSLPDLSEIRVKSLTGKLVPLSEVASWQKRILPHPIYHKNLHPVVYVVGDMAGKEEAPIYGILKINKALHRMRAPDGSPIKVLYTHLPFSAREWAVKWDGEWQVTYEVFRDLGLAFGACLILIYFLVVAWFKSYTVPLVILAPIPLSLIGIIPAHALMGAFFTATSMIGFIAGAGIVVRNSIILADFIELRLAQGWELEEAVIDAGAVRFRPMLLTASAVVVGSFVILFDPIFNGLALSLMAGEVASTLFSRMVVPILYYLDHRIKRERRLVL